MTKEKEGEVIRKVNRAAYVLLEAEAELMEEEPFSPDELRCKVGGLCDAAHAAIHRLADKRRRQCEACGGQHWLIFNVTSFVRDNGYYVQRCDECSDPEVTDYGAVKLAKAAGLKCSREGLVSITETKRWMKIYPNRGIVPKEVTR